MTVDTLVQADSTDSLLFPEIQYGENVSTTATVSCQNALLEVESAAKFPSTTLVDLDLNPIENHLENNVAGKKKKRRKKKNNNNNCTAAMANLEVTLPNAESAVQLPAQELQGLDMNLADNLEVMGGNRKRKRRKKKNLNKPTNNVLDVDSTAKLLAPKNQERGINMTEIQEKSESGEKPTNNVLDVDSTAALLAPKNQERDINMTEIEEKSESGEKSASGKKRRRKRRKLNKPASNVIDVESTSEVLVPEHQESDICSHNNIEQKTTNGQKRKRGENIEPTSDDQHVELTAQLLPPDNQEKKKKKRRKVKRAANNNIDTVFNSTRVETNLKSSWEIKKAFEAEDKDVPMLGNCRDVFLKWQPPGYGFVMLNVDGSLNATNGRAGGGGILRDEKGSWKGGFMCRGHSLYATQVEAWALMKGLEWAWEKGVRRLMIQSDSMEVLDLVHKRIESSGLLNNTIRRCCWWIARDWTIILSHCYREQNRVADLLAKRAKTMYAWWEDIEQPDPGLMEKITEDLMGLPRQRRIRKRPF